MVRHADPECHPRYAGGWRAARGCLIAAASLSVACGGDTKVVAARTDAGPELELAGTWHQCGSRLELGSDGTFTRTNLLGGCSESGSYGLSDGVLSLTFSSSDCAKPSESFTATPVSSGGRLVLVKPTGTETYYDDSAGRARWQLDGKGSGVPANGSSIVRIVGDALTGAFSGCYWSSDGACGGLLSCGGSVEAWSLQAGSLVAKLGCGGPCPCAAVLQGQAGPSGAISGTFSALDCGASYEGSFQATPQDEP